MGLATHIEVCRAPVYTGGGGGGGGRGGGGVACLDLKITLVTS